MGGSSRPLKQCPTTPPLRTIIGSNPISSLPLSAGRILVKIRDMGIKMITDYYKNGCRYKLKTRERDLEILSDLELWGILDELQVDAVFHKEKPDMALKNLPVFFKK